MLERQEPDRWDFIQSEKEIDRYSEQANSVHSKMYLSRCSFDTEVFSMKAFDDFLLIGMRNSLGVVPLKQKNDAIYTLRVKNIYVTVWQRAFNQVMVFGTNLVLFGDSKYYFYCNLQDFKDQINNILENHQTLEKNKIIRQI
jgi:hypothetical protein